MQVFENIAYMKLSVGSTAYEYSKVLGYYFAGDGGGGDFYWDPDSHESDNGGTIFKATDEGGRWKRIMVSEILVTWFGAKKNGVTDDSTAINNSINYAIEQNRSVLFPAGQYLIKTSIIWNKPIHLIGEQKGGPNGGNYVTIIAGAEFSTMVSGSVNISDTGNTSRSYFEGINLDGKNIVDYGFRGVTNHSTFKGFRVSGTKLCAMSIGYGWCNLFEDLELSYNRGNGLDLETYGGQANGVLISSNKIFFNGGIGLKVGSGYATKVMSSVIEQNKVCGIFISNNSKGFSIDNCYFEANSETGFNFILPEEINIKSDIIITGAGTSTTIAAATPSYGSITNCFISPSAEEMFVFGNGLSTINMFGNRSELELPLLEFYGNNSLTGYYSSYGLPQTLFIGANSGFSKNIEIKPIARGVLNTGNRFREYSILGADNNNIAVTDLSKWVKIYNDSGGAFTKRTQRFNGWEVFELIHSAGSSDSFGFEINCNDYHSLWNKLVVFAIWTNHPYAGNGNIDLIINSSFTQPSYSSNANVWNFSSGIFKMPSSGVVKFGVRKIGAAGTCLVSAPVLAEVGSDLNLLAYNSNL